jgi:DNA-binding response OmpR family regulator
MKSLENAFIVVLEPNYVYQRVIVQYLQVAGFNRILTFSDPIKMLPALKFKPDIIITEYSFGQYALSGKEILTKIRAESPNTNVYFHTMHNNVASAVNSIKAGATDYMLKTSTSLDELVRKIMAHLNHHSNATINTGVLKKLASYI